MSKALRIAIEEVRPSVSWRPHYAPVAAPPPPCCCYHEFMAWAECVQKGASTDASMSRLFDCIHKHSNEN